MNDFKRYNHKKCVMYLFKNKYITFIILIAK